MTHDEIIANLTLPREHKSEQFKQSLREAATEIRRMSTLLDNLPDKVKQLEIELLHTAHNFEATKRILNEIEHLTKLSHRYCD